MHGQQNIKKMKVDHSGGKDVFHSLT